MTISSNSPKTIASALAELSVELGISEADFGGKLKIEGKDPVVASRHHLTMALTIFAIAQAPLALRLRFPDLSVIRRERFFF